MLFVIGGARSGKSRYAQNRMEALPGKLAFIATAQAHDAEMQDRIARHQADRGPCWQTFEAPVELPCAIDRAATCADAVLVDCLTLWLSNLMLAQRDVAMMTDHLIAALERCPCPSLLSRMRSAWELCRKMRSRVDFATMRAASINASPRSRRKWSWLPLVCQST